MSTPLERLQKWFASPQDRMGLITWGVGLVQTGYSEYVAHSFSLPVFAGWAIAGLVAVIVPDNSVLKSDVQQLVSDGVSAGMAKNLQANMNTILADAAKTAVDSGVKL